MTPKQKRIPKELAQLAKVVGEGQATQIMGQIRELEERKIKNFSVTVPRGKLDAAREAIRGLSDDINVKDHYMLSMDGKATFNVSRKARLAEFDDEQREFGAPMESPADLEKIIFGRLAQKKESCEGGEKKLFDELKVQLEGISEGLQAHAEEVEAAKQVEKVEAEGEGKLLEKRFVFDTEWQAQKAAEILGETGMLGDVSVEERKALTAETVDVGWAIVLRHVPPGIIPGRNKTYVKVDYK
jgi:hypothetical protein